MKIQQLCDDFLKFFVFSLFNSLDKGRRMFLKVWLLTEIKDEIDVKKAELQKLEEHKIRRAAEWGQFIKEVNLYFF